LQRPEQALQYYLSVDIARHPEGWKSAKEMLKGRNHHFILSGLLPLAD